MGRGEKHTSIDVNEGDLRGASSPDDGRRRRRRDADANLPQTVPGESNLPAAFDLIAEACAAVKIAEDRVHFAEEALEDATDQIETLTQQLSAADRRAEIAERHAERAEERLRIFCQTILTTMHGVQ